jgi:hypothetical protein
MPLLDVQLSFSQFLNSSREANCKRSVMLFAAWFKLPHVTVEIVLLN